MQKQKNASARGLMTGPQLVDLIRMAKTQKWDALDLSKKGISRLPRNIGELINIRKLTLSENQLTGLPETIGALKNLVRLDLRQNRLTMLPGSIGDLASLEGLNLDSNKLTKLPKSIGNLKNLRRLRLRQNDLEALPESIGNLKNLRQLDLSRTNLTKLPKFISELTNLETLDLGSNSLKTLPESIGNLTNLGRLDIGQNSLKTLPESIGNLRNLKWLDLSANSLVDLPESMKQLTNLQRINLSQNKLIAFPEVIAFIESLESLTLSDNKITSLPDSIRQLVNLKTLKINLTLLSAIPETIGQLKSLVRIQLRRNQLTSLPEIICQCENLEGIELSSNYLTSVPESIGQLKNLRRIELSNNEIRSLPESIGRLESLEYLLLGNNQLEILPLSFKQLASLLVIDLRDNRLGDFPEVLAFNSKLEHIALDNNKISTIPDDIGLLKRLDTFSLSRNRISSLPESIRELKKLRILYLGFNSLTYLPDSVGELSSLSDLNVDNNQLITLPPSIGQLPNLRYLSVIHNSIKFLPSELARQGNFVMLNLDGNPLDPALKSSYDQGLPAIMAYLRSLEEAEPLYESKLIFVGEGGVGKTTLLKALTGQRPREGEPTTHGVSIDIHSLLLPYPENEEVNIQFNAWDFGGQEVYRATHQFFFSRRSIYLLLWRPRFGIEQSRVEEWLKMIRLRVGAEARVIIIATHSRTDQRIPRIDEPVLRRDFPGMIVDFHEVDSLVPDEKTGMMVGVAELQASIANAAKDLEQMGMPFNVNWTAARDELIAAGELQPRISYQDFVSICAKHKMNGVDARTLAGLMHDLGYIVYYGEDERLKNDVVLQPEWLTKAIGFVLEDRKTQEMDGILPDTRLREVWAEHPFNGEQRYSPELYPFFLQLMEKYDVSYRIETGDASLVAQHVPQVRPPLPWLPEEEAKPNMRRLAMVCLMDEAPPGLVPWMIVRTHDYAYEISGHRLHWQKGMFLRYKRHGEALLELRGREFHIYAEAVWPEYFLNVLRQTLMKLITDNWPGMKGRYRFAVPCQEKVNGKDCEGRFDISALRTFHEEGDTTIRCQVCRTRQNIVDLLYGFMEEDSRAQLARIESRLEIGFEVLQREIAGLESRLANYVMAIMRAMANEAKMGPRLFTIEPIDGEWRWIKKEYRLLLWCEAEDCQHPVYEHGLGVYEFEATREWIKQIAPYINFAAKVLKTVLPMVAPAVNVLFGADTFDQWKYRDHLNLIQVATSGLLPKGLSTSDLIQFGGGVLSESERSGILALHAFLRQEDPNQERLGLHRVPTYTGDYLWLCRTHFEQIQPRIPKQIE